MCTNTYLMSLGLANIVVILFALSPVRPAQEKELVDEQVKINSCANLPTTTEKALDINLDLQKAVSDLVRLAIYGKNAEVRWSSLITAAWTIGIEKAYDPDAVAGIIGDAIISGTREQKTAALTLLSESGEVGKPLIPLLVLILRTDPNDFGPQAANALGRIGTGVGGVVPELLEAYKHAGEINNSAMRAQAALALGRLRTREIIGALVKDTTSQLPSVKLSAVMALGLYSTIPDDAIRSLCVVAKSERRETIKSEAIKALSNYDCGQKALVTEVILDGLGDKSPVVRRSAITAVRKLRISNANVLEKLINIASTTTNALLYVNVVDALAGSGDDGIPVFRQVLKRGEYKRKTVAAEVLARISTEAVKVLVDSHLNGEPHEEWVATEAMGKADAYVDLVEPVLLSVLERNYMSYHALNAITRLKYKSNRWIKTLCKIIRDSTYGIPTRDQALRVICDFGLEGPDIEEALGIASRDENADIANRSKELLEALKRKAGKASNEPTPGNDCVSEKEHKKSSQ